MTTLPDLTRCDVEPIHVPGAIQPHKMLLALDGPSLTVTQASANVQELLGRPTAQLLGRRLEGALGRALADGVGGALERHLELPSLAATFGWRQGEGATSFTASVHRSGQRTVLELLPTGPLAPPEARDEEARAFRKVRDQPDLPGKAQAAAEWVRRLSGYDRVMVYRFHEDAHGEVVAEARREDLEPFLGLHYPASDIPAQARRLFLESPTRGIVDAAANPVALVPVLDPRTGEPLDLSRSVLRAVSPVHLEYLANMGVRATLVAPLVRDRALWGLISCHHLLPHPVTAHTRQMVDWMAQDLSTQLSELEKAQRERTVAHLREGRERVLQALRQGTSLEDLLRGPQAAALLSALAADGAAVIRGEQVTCTGTTPAAAQVLALSGTLPGLGDGTRELVATDCLGELLPEARHLAPTAAGVGLVPLQEGPGARLMWFRAEWAREVTWGGNPDKAVNLTEEGRITPRKSFAAWTQSVRGRSRPWSREALESARELRAMFDIEQRRVAEEALRQSEVLLGNVVDSLGAHLAVLDGAGSIVAVNRAWREFAAGNCGTEQCLPGASYLAVCEAAIGSPEGPDALQALQGIREVLAGSRPAFSLEYPCHAPTRQRWFVMRVFPLSGGRPGAVVAHEDVTASTLAAQHQAEVQRALERERQRYLTLMTIAQDGIHLLDAEGTLVEANDAFLHSLGYTREDLGRRKVGDWDVGLPPHQVRSMLASLLNAPGLFQTRHRRVDGSVIEVELNAGGVELEGRRYVLASSRNVTARRELEMQLAARQAQLVELNRSLEQRVGTAVAELRAKDQLLISQARQAAMGEMIGNIAHQWRQPLNALGLLLHGLKEAQAHQALDQASLDEAVGEGQVLVQRMSTTIDDFRDFFRPHKGQAAFQVLAQVEKTVAMVGHGFRSAGIALRVEVPPGLLVSGPPNELSQVLLNLLVNAKDAIQATGAEEGRVEVRGEEQGDDVVLTVTDTGGGIAPEARERLFEPFFTTKPSGTGVGLSMSRMIVERSLRGRLEARDVEGGAEFTITCPRAGVAR